MRTAFIKTLCELAERDERIWLLTGDLGYSVLECFATRFPDRFVNMGVAEQNMTGVAAGLALCDKIPFTYSIANFPIMRCLEQIRNDVCYHNLNVKIVVVGGGLAYDSAGYTHHGVEDLAIMRALPNMTLIAPGDPVEAELATRAIIEHSGPCYLRLGRNGEPVVHQHKPEFKISEPIVVREGSDVLLISTGGLLAIATAISTHLAKFDIDAGVLSLHTIKPINSNSVAKFFMEPKIVVTLEEHSLIGGLKEIVSSIIVEHNLSGKNVLNYGIPESLNRKVGSRDYLLKSAGIDLQEIVRQIRKAI